MRHNFSAKVKREALERSGGQCEAVGERYGHPAGVRCQNKVSKGHVHFDHWPRGAHDPHPDTVTLGNCVCTCPSCNRYAAHHFDTPREAKMKRVQRKHGPKEGRKKTKPIRNRGFSKQRQPLRSRSTFQKKEKPDVQ